MPSPYDNEIVFGIDPDCVVSCALRTKARTGQAGPRHAVRVEPPQVTIIGEEGPSRGCPFDPRFGQNLPAVPAAPAEHKIAISRVIPCTHPDSTAPAASSADRFHFLSANVHVHVVISNVL